MDYRDIKKVFLGLQKIWSLEDGPYWQKCLEELPLRSGFSREMIRLSLREMKNLFDYDAFQTKIKTELGPIPLFPDFYWDERAHRFLQWMPMESVLHVLSGNVFLVGPSSWMLSVMTGHKAIFKLPSDDPFFMPLFIKSLCEVEQSLGLPPLLSERVETVSFSSDRTDLMAQLCEKVEAIVVWGGEAAVKSYQKVAPSSKRMIIFGPKVSLAYVTKKGVEEVGLLECAKALSLELSLWDQAACTAPQVLYVEGEDLAQKLMHALGAMMEERQKTLPQGSLSDDAAAEIRKIRTHYEIAEICQTGHLLASQGDNLHWTLYIEKKDKDFIPSPLHRTLKIVPFTESEGIFSLVEKLKGPLQTLGLLASKEEYMSLAEKLISIGALKVTPIGTMHGGAIDDAHDGRYDLPQFFHLTTVYSPYDDPSPQIALLLKKSRQSPWYAKRLEHLSINPTLEDFKKIPIMTKEDWHKRMPPHSFELATCDSPHGGYVTRSGGSTGTPQFSWFTQKDWEGMVDVGVSLFRQMGMTPKDRVANCFLSGDLYGSFLSFGEVCKKVGMTIFPFAGRVTGQTLLEVSKQFHINVFQGCPSFMMPLLREVKKLDPHFSFEKVIYAGEPLGLCDKKFLLEELAVSEIISFIGTTEAGAIGYSNLSCKENEYYVADSRHLYLEVVDEKGCDLPLGEKGRLLVTPLFKTDFPILRYDIGDQAALLGDGKMLYYGRGDSIICIGMMNFNVLDVEKVLSSYKVRHLQCIVTKEDSNYLDRLEIVIDGDIKDPKAISHSLFRELAEFEDHIKAGYLDVIISFREILPDPRTGKIKKVIDKRPGQL